MIENNKVSKANGHKKLRSKPRRKHQKRTNYDLTLKYKPSLYNFWIDYFTRRDRPRFIRHIKNGMKFKDIVTKLFIKHGLPKDLFYVGLIESGFNTKTRSRAKATGPWQFIKGTATRYGLRVDSYVDERYNIHKSTEAAARYLKDLYNIFGSWELALCGYNAGEYKVINAIRRGNSRNYLELVKRKLLPKETVYYISKVVAARELYNKKSTLFLLNDLKKSRNLYSSATQLSVKKSFNRVKFSKKVGVQESLLKRLNPDWKKEWIKVSQRRPLKIYLPKKTINKPKI